MVADESVLADKIDLASENDRKAFAGKLSEEYPAVDGDEIEAELLKLCDNRASRLAAAEDGRDSSLPDMIAQIASDQTELFHDEDQNAFAAIEVNGHVETWPVKSKGFRLWLRRRLREEHDRSAGSEAFNAALEEIEARALFDGPEVMTAVRLSEHNGEIWLDLCDEQWRAVRITTAGWQIEDGKLPVRFIRTRGMLPLAPPETGGSIDGLREFLNVRDGADFVLLVSWLLGCLRPKGPYPVLSVNGEQGSAKSTTQKLLRALIDPNSAPLRSEPRDPRDLVISASNSWIIGFDNLSSIRSWFSDAVCRLSTGGGFATRELYSNDSEMIFECQRPVMFNGITDVVNRSDLLDRSLLITLAAIGEERRKPEKKLWAEFAGAQPKILGALLDAVAAGLARESTVTLEKLPRMADFAVWVTACETGLGWPAGTFMAAYAENRNSANETAMEASPVGTAVLTFMAETASWQGTSRDLLDELDKVTDEKTRHRKDWPRTARKLSGDLRRVAPNLRLRGLDVTSVRSTDKARQRLFVLTKVEDPTESDEPTESDDSAESEDPAGVNGTVESDGSNESDGSDPTYRPPPTSLFNKHLQLSSDGSDGIVHETPSPSEDLRVQWKERVAICMLDGGLSEIDAQAVASREVPQMPPENHSRHVVTY